MSVEINRLFFQQQGNPEGISGLFFPLRISKNQFPQGNFNRSFVVIDSTGQEYIIRQENPYGRSLELPFVEAEYKGVGFLGHPQNGFRLRTAAEQHQFTTLLRENGIKASRTIYSKGNIQIISYENGAVNIADLWINADQRAPTATDMALIKLAESHDKGFILGDRWGPNEILTTDGEIMFVDFDIEISGPEAKEFEMASMLYFNSYFAQQPSSIKDLNRLLEIYKQFFASSLFTKVYNKPLLFDYLTRYFSYFANDGNYRWQNQNQASNFLQKLR